jgi:hypothetical protein
MAKGPLFFRKGRGNWKKIKKLVKTNLNFWQTDGILWKKSGREGDFSNFPLLSCFFF